MAHTRLPKFKRVVPVALLQLTDRDREILRLVHRHRFLRSPQIASLLDARPQPLLRRLQRLYHHGYLERPRAQLDYYQKGGSRPIVYGLGNKGGTLLQQEPGEAFRPLSWGEKNRAVGRIFLEHALLVSEVMVALELACRKSGVRLLPETELAPSGTRRPFHWRVQLDSRRQLGVVPDRVFALEYEDQDGIPERAYFFLEADRGTMPVKRSNLAQTSFHRKLLAYEATWSQDIHRRRFGFHRFRVLTVTSSTTRVESLLEACAELKRGHGLFLFANRSILDHPDILFAPIWQSGRGGEATSLLP